VISVSDGTALAALPAFTLVVAQTGVTGSATVSWTPPTTNTDNSPLTDLESYRVMYGRASGSLDQVVSVNSGAASYTVDNLTQGTWYFAVVAVNSRGDEGELSNVASKTIN
jgi:hypothetical protein